MGYRYPITCLPPLLILFGPGFHRKQSWDTFDEYGPSSLKRLVVWDRKSIPGWWLLLLFLCSHLSPEFIEGNRRFTLEGNFMGLYMFEANHQCISKATITFQGGAKGERNSHRAIARNRCDPYPFWFKLKRQCEERKGRIKRIAWTFDHSVNGSPFYRSIDLKNLWQDLLSFPAA